MDTTRGQRKLIDDAIAEGYTVNEQSQRVDINKGKTKQSVGITLWPDGVATRNDIDFSVCTAIQTLKAMRKILGLGE